MHIRNSRKICKSLIIFFYIIETSTLTYGNVPLLKLMIRFADKRSKYSLVRCNYSGNWGSINLQFLLPVHRLETADQRERERQQRVRTNRLPMTVK